MKDRRQRIKKVAELRDKQLQQHVAELGRSQKHEAAVKQRVETARQAMGRAEEDRRQLGTHDTTSLTLIETEEWLALQSYRLDEATRELLKAHRVRAQRELDVMRARRKLRQLQKVDERLGAREKTELERAERRQHDELASLLRARSRG